METTERIVEAYVRYVRGCATIPNIRCEGGYEIDLLAIHPVTHERYHIEVGVSVSGSFSKLTGEPFSPAALQDPKRKPGQRRTVGFFKEKKFGPPAVLRTLERYGFRKGNYRKVIVSWGWTDEAAQQARADNIELWDLRDLMREIVDTYRNQRSYFTDDTLRTLHLFDLASRTTRGLGGGG